MKGLSRRLLASLILIAAVWLIAWPVNFIFYLLEQSRFSLSFHDLMIAFFRGALTAMATSPISLLVAFAAPDWIIRHTKWDTCVKCEYDLRGLRSSRCPECGVVIKRIDGASGDGV